MTLDNPEFLIEILSKSTARHDLTRKKEAYATIESIKESWFVASKEVHVFQCVRYDDGWTFRHFTDLDEKLESDHFDLELPLREIYHRVFTAGSCGRFNSRPPLPPPSPAARCLPGSCTDAPPSSRASEARM